MNVEAGEFEERLRNSLRSLGLGHWSVRWLPDPSSPVRGRVIPEKLLILIHDVDENGAWNTFLHEVVEIKLRSALRPYRVLVNKLIEGYQEIVDSEKDKFIESFLGTLKAARSLDE